MSLQKGRLPDPPDKLIKLIPQHKNIQQIYNVIYVK